MQSVLQAKRLPVQSADHQAKSVRQAYAQVRDLSLSFTNQRADLLIVTIMVLVLVASLLVLAVALYPTRRNEKQIHDTRFLVTLGAEKSGKALLATVDARTRANKAIAEVFGLYNAFTTHESNRRHEFKRDAAQLIGSAPWENLTAYAQISLDGKIVALQRDVKAEEPRGDRMVLAELVQHLTFTVALRFLFPDTVPEKLDIGSVKTATYQINRLWMMTKDTKIEELVPFGNQRELRNALSSFFDPESLQWGKQNPMNFIIPAYEAIWRVVLLGYLECQRHDFRPQSPGQTRADVFQQSHLALEHILSNPNMEKDYGREPNESDQADAQFNAFDISKEALRLYSSTKSVYREIEVQPRTLATKIREFLPGVQMSTTDAPKFEKARADVESLHRLEARVWLDDKHRDTRGKTISALQFYPRRWLRDMPEGGNKDMAYIPFGIWPLGCPAKLDFGERMVAILIATLARRLESMEVVDKIEGEDSLRATQPLPSSRGDLDRWEVILPNEVGPVPAEESGQSSHAAR